MVFKHRITMATNGSGAATAYTPDPVDGEVMQIRYIKTDFADGSTMTLTGEDSGVAIWAETGVNASATRAPRQASHTTAGVAATLDGTRPALVPVAVARERLKVIVASGGDTKTGYLDIYVRA